MTIWIDTLRYKNLVYTRTYKCASTYLCNFLKKKGFERIDINDLNEEDKMFTFIQNPYVRRVKGIAEVLFDTGCERKLTEQNFVKLIKDATVLDHHTIPYSAQYRNYMNRILFFPIDSEVIGLDDLLIKFFAVHCPELNNVHITENIPKNLGSNTEGYGYNGKIKKIKIRAYDFIKKFATNKELSELVLADDYVIWSNSKRSVETDLDTYLTSKYQ